MDINSFLTPYLCGCREGFSTQLGLLSLIEKLHVYGFHKCSFKLFSYLNNRWDRTKINQNFSSWKLLIQGVSQGSVLGPLLFNIYLNGLFYLTESTEVCNFADGTNFFLPATKI